MEHTGGAAEVPCYAVVTPEQAESALGHAQATEYDEDCLDTLDEDQKKEEIALIGKIVNPDGAQHACVSWSPVSDSDIAKTVGWHPPYCLKELTAADFVCTG